LGLLTIDLGEHVSAAAFLPGAVNLFCMTFCLTGITHAGFGLRPRSLADHRHWRRLLHHLADRGSRPPHLEGRLVAEVRHVSSASSSRKS